MPKQKIRFAVGAPDGPRSAIWSLFWRDKDAYALALEAGGMAKITFHLGIGEFSWGYTKEYFEANKAALSHMRSRDFERWKRPPQFEPGLTLPFRIYVANEALRTDQDLPTAKDIRWVQPRSGQAVGFVFLLTDLGLPDDPYASLADLELLNRATFSEHPEALLLYAHHTDAAKVSEAANRSIVQFTAEYPEVLLPQRHRLYTQVDAPEPATGSRNIIEIPTYVLPFSADTVG